MLRLSAAIPASNRSAEDDCGLFFASTSLRDTANPLHLADTYIDITKVSARVIVQ